MRTWMFGLTMAAALLIPARTTAASCCGGHDPQVPAGHQHEAAPPAAAKAMPCCEGHAPAAEPKAKGCCEPAPAMAAGCCDTGIPDDPKVAMAGLGLTNPLPVKTMAVHFREPVQVGSVVLMGWYVIEHDDDRMARGEPCTYIYENDPMREPVATFHCTHLEHEAPGVATVVLRPTVNPSIKALAEFQFSGETASHGVPAVR